MADIQRSLAIDPINLTRVVRGILGCDTATVVDWETTPLTDGMGGFGVYQVNGHARMFENVVPWTVVLKTTERQPAHDDPCGWNYWKREALLYSSGILDDLPPGLRAARCFLVEDRPPDSIWLWLEMLMDADAKHWPRARYQVVGERLGRFNGAYLTERVLPIEPWLQGSWLRSCIDWHSLHLASFPDHLGHPLVRRAWPMEIAAGVLQVWEERETLLDALDQLPQTFCHRDIFVRNLFLVADRDKEDEATAIDWAFAGRGAVGEEAVTLLAGGLSFFDVTSGETSVVDRELFAGYLAGLAACGWTGDPRQVRLGHTAAFALRCGLAWVGTTLPVLLQNDEETLEAACQKLHRRSLAESLDRAREITSFALQRGDEARQLLHVVP